MRRTNSYDKQLSQRLKDPKYAQGFLLALLEHPDGLSVEEALRHTIERMGVKEFSGLSGFPPSNIVDFLKGRRQCKPDTLDKMLRPFQLRTKLTLATAS